MMMRIIHTHRPHCRGYTIIAFLITIACIIALIAISMTAINKAVTGEGSAVEGTVRSTLDSIRLTAIYQSMLADADQFPQSRYLVPSILDGSNDWSKDTTANIFSAMVMRNYIRPHDLIAANEYSGYVQPMEDYNYNAYDPAAGVFWDTRFEADLNRGSNVSFAHMPLFGERYEDGWRATMNSRIALLGNRGPENGIDNPASWTYGRNKQWGGHVVFGDGSITFTHSFTPAQLSIVVDGERRPDNIFAMETGPGGDDAILAFTKEITKNGPVLQFD